MKTCRTCKEAKDESAFYPHDGMCKPCRCAKVRANRLARLGYYQKWDRERYKNNPERRKKSQEYLRKRRLEDPQKSTARYSVSNAVRDGRLEKPDQCSCCGSKEKIQAHHTDYSKPLDVVWVCFKCHREKYHGQRVSA